MVANKIKNAIKRSVQGVRSPKDDAPELMAESFVGLWLAPSDLHIEEPPPLDEKQQGLEQELESYSKEIALPESDEYSKWEQRWLALPGTAARSLRAENWKLEKAKDRLKSTMEWRREYKPDLIPPTEIMEETEGGKIICSGFTKDGMPIIYLRPAKENTEPSERQIRHMVFMLERAIDMMPRGQSKVAMIVDFKGASARSSPPMKITKSVIQILQHHYPERLGKALVCNMPWYLKSFFSTVSPFLDEQTRQKLQMNPNLIEVVPKAQLDADLGGEYKFVYSHQVYLPAICEWCGVAPDGTRFKDHAGPTEDYEAVTPALLSGGSRQLSSHSRHAPSARTQSSRTLVEETPERVDGKKATSASSQTSAKRRKGGFGSCICGSATGFDDDEPAAPEKRKPRRKSSQRHLPFHGSRLSALERVRKDANTEAVEEPDETQHVESAFKRGEPVHFSRSSDHPEIVHALEASTKQEMREAPLLRLDSKNDAVDKARELLDSERTGDLAHATSDHAQVLRPLQNRKSTLDPNELTFDVSSR